MPDLQGLSKGKSPTESDKDKQPDDVARLYGWAQQPRFNAQTDNAGQQQQAEEEAKQEEEETAEATPSEAEALEQELLGGPGLTPADKLKVLRAKLARTYASLKSNPEVSSIQVWCHCCWKCLQSLCV